MHPLDEAGGVAHQRLELSHVTAMNHDRVFRSKRSGQQAERVQRLNPLAVKYIGLAAKLFDLARLDEDHFEAASLEQLKQRYPVDGS